MKCKKCGAELKKGQTVCPNCAELSAAEETQPRKTRKQRKKEKILKITFSIVAGVLAVAMTVGLILTGINEGWGKANNIYRKGNYGTSEWIAKLYHDQVVATAGSYELTNGQLQVLYTLWVTDYLSQFGENLQYAQIDLNKSLGDQIYDPETGMTWEKFFLQQALLEWREYCAINMKAEENKYELPAEFAEQLANLEKVVQKSSVEAGFKDADDMLKHQMGNNVSFEDYHNYLSFYYVYNHYGAELAKNIEVSDAEVEQYFKDNATMLKDSYGIDKNSGYCVDVRHILIKPEGGKLGADGKTTTYSEEEWEACRVKAQAVYDEWLAGDKTEDSFSKLANEKSQDQDGKVTDGGLCEDVFEGGEVTAFNDWCFDGDRKPGDHGLVMTEYGYHVMYFVEEEPIWSAYCRRGLRTQKSEKMTSEYIDKLDWKVDYTKIVLDDFELS